MGAQLRPAAVSGTTLQRLADEDLMPLMAAGDAHAFEILYLRHRRAVYSLAYRICGARSSAEEVAQEAFLAVWRSGARYDRSRGSVRTWLLWVVHNRAVDALRRTSAHARVHVADEHAAESVEAPERTELEVARREESRAMQALLRELPSEQRRVIDLAYFGGFTQAQIAERVQIPLGTVKGRTRRALDSMRTASIYS